MHSDAGRPSGCPPEGAVPESGSFYRLSAPRHSPGDSTTEDSWVLPLNTRKGPHYGNSSRCGAHAFSLFRDLESLRQARELNAWAARKSIAMVDLDEDHGLVLDTPSEVGDSHCDWWPEPPSRVPDATIVESRHDR
ncbi:hypothetical protein [Demequina aurantiaca]|uniref:hypothetical protein n=1 Tax=Demequina aurantiaca TaxID=676200 RepID=UPI00128B7CBF|nr:hypothetical protein [Demequina aurantiaca]